MYFSEFSFFSEVVAALLKRLMYIVYTCTLYFYMC